MTKSLQAPTIKRGWLRSVLIIIPFFIVSGIFQLTGVLFSSQILKINPMSILQNPDHSSTLPLLVVQVFELIGTLLLVWVFTRFIDRKKIIGIGFSLKKRTNDILYGLLTGIIMMGLGSLILYFTGHLTYESISFDLIGLTQALFLFILVAINEEVFVRGYLLRNFMCSMNRYLALILSSMLFMSFHLLNPNLSVIGAINLFLAGLLLGIGYIFTQNLWFPMALHFSWNFFQGPILGFEVSGTHTSSLITNSIQGSDLLTGGRFGFEGSLIATALCALCIFLFWSTFRSQDFVKTSNNKIA